MNLNLIYNKNMEIYYSIEEEIKKIQDVDSEWSIISKFIDNYVEEDVNVITQNFYEYEILYNNLILNLKAYLNKIERINEKIIKKNINLYEDIVGLKNYLVNQPSLKYIDSDLNSICYKFLEFIQFQYNDLTYIDKVNLGFYNFGKNRVLNFNYLKDSHKKLYVYIDLLIKLESIKECFINLSAFLMGINCNYINSEELENETIKF